MSGFQLGTSLFKDAYTALSALVIADWHASGSTSCSGAETKKYCMYIQCFQLIFEDFWYCCLFNHIFLSVHD